ncbi:MAG: hypothetical protein OXG15_10280 [Gammaproteobacteria bacterium]|nr:hypothetical protein [Gammaproteobacteria bacterium]
MTKRKKEQIHAVRLTLTPNDFKLLNRVAKQTGLPKTRALIQGLYLMDEVQSSRKLLIDPTLVAEIKMKTKDDQLALGERS